MVQPSPHIEMSFEPCFVSHTCMTGLIIDRHYALKMKNNRTEKYMSVGPISCPNRQPHYQNVPAI